MGELRTRSIAALVGSYSTSCAPVAFLSHDGDEFLLVEVLDCVGEIVVDLVHIGHDLCPPVLYVKLSWGIEWSFLLVSWVSHLA